MKREIKRNRGARARRERTGAGASERRRPRRRPRRRRARVAVEPRGQHAPVDDAPVQQPDRGRRVGWRRELDDAKAARGAVRVGRDVGARDAARLAAEVLQVLPGKGEGQAVDDDGAALGGRRRAAAEAATLGAARERGVLAVLADDDSPAAELRVAQERDRAERERGLCKLDDAAALGAPLAVLEDARVEDGARLPEVVLRGGRAGAG
jgi:hypothetical protein